MSILDDRIMYNVRRGMYKYIGSGSSRDVFEMNNEYVIKVARNNAGIEQNKTEYKISNNKKYDVFANVVYASNNYKFIIMKKAKRIKQIYDVWYYFNVSSKQQFINLRLIREIVNRYGLIINDLCRENSWGIINGRIKIIDYGFTRRVKERYYN